MVRSVTHIPHRAIAGAAAWLLAAGCAVAADQHPEKLALRCDVGIERETNGGDGRTEVRRQRAIVPLEVDIDISPQWINGTHMVNVEFRSLSPVLPMDPIRTWFTGDTKEVGEWLGDELKIIAPKRNPPVEVRVNRRTGIFVYTSTVLQDSKTVVVEAKGECRRVDGKRQI